MTTKRTVKYHVPQQGLYVYARTEEGSVQRKVEQNLLF